MRNFLYRYHRPSPDVSQADSQDKHQIDPEDGKTRACDRARTFDTFVDGKKLTDGAGDTPPVGHSASLKRGFGKLKRLLLKSKRKDKGKGIEQNEGRGTQKDDVGMGKEDKDGGKGTGSESVKDGIDARAHSGICLLSWLLLTWKNQLDHAPPDSERRLGPV